MQVLEVNSKPSGTHLGAKQVSKSSGAAPLDAETFACASRSDLACRLGAKKGTEEAIRNQGGTNSKQKRLRIQMAPRHLIFNDLDALPRVSQNTFAVERPPPIEERREDENDATSTEHGG